MAPADRLRFRRLQVQRLVRRARRKIKTSVGLFTDSQDMEFLHTWAILPQSIYPLDLRASTIAHTGGDVYGEIPVKRAGSLSYTGFCGRRTGDKFGGIYFATEDTAPLSR